MKFCSIHEWDYLQLSECSDAPNSVTREDADRLLSAARAAARRLKFGGEGSESVLVDGRHRLRAGQVVGVVVTSDVALEILPKIDRSDARLTRESLVRMLARTLDLPIADGALTQLGLQRYDLLEIVIR